MNDKTLIDQLHYMAEYYTMGSEYAPDEHVAWQAAERIEALEAEIKEWESGAIQRRWSEIRENDINTEEKL